MKTISTYQKEARLRVLLQGPPGSGKTTTASQFPKSYVADCDANLAGALRWLKANGKPLPVGYDTIDEVEPKSRFAHLVKCVGEAAASPDVETIILDSATKISDYIMAHVLAKQGKSQMEMTSWGFYLSFWKDLIAQLSTCKKHLVLLVHEKVEKDEIDQTLKYFLAIPGQFGGIAGALFTDVWRCEAETKGFGAAAKTEYVVRTSPNFKFQLKNSFGLPVTLPFDWAKIEALL